MKISQKRAIYYAERERKLKKIEALGLMDEYIVYRGKSPNEKIEWFCKKKGIRL